MNSLYMTYTEVTTFRFCCFDIILPYLSRLQYEMAMLFFPLAGFYCQIFNLMYRVQTPVDGNLVVYCAFARIGKRWHLS